MSGTDFAITEALKTRMREVEYNPAALQRIALETLKQVHNNEVEVIDADTPFGFAIQTTAVMTSAAIEEMEALNRKQYPITAQTEDDLYLHMSDRDYLNRFAIPSRAKFRFVFDKTELLQKMVEDVDLGIRKVVIPRNTQVTINNTIFTLPYPIEIRQLYHGGIQIIFNTNISSPIATLDTNIIEYRVINTRDMELLSFEVELYQMQIRTVFSDTDSVSNTEEDIILNDAFYYLRAFIEQSDGSWLEFPTTHSEQIYDPNQLTGVLRVYRDRVNVKIPQIYSTRGMVNGRLRFDLYETKGELNMDLNIYPAEVFTTKFVTDLFDVASTVYSAPLKNFKTLFVLSEDLTQGGNREMTFEELRKVVVNNSVGSQVLPITPIQAETSLLRSGYDIVKNIDNVTNRTFLATRQLPEPSNRRLMTPAAASIETIYITEKEARAVESVKQNFRSVTLTPDTLFENKNGVMKLVSTSRVKAIQGQRAEMIANEVSSNDYFYTPFHYVLEFEHEEFQCRPYYLDKPGVVYKTFISDNDRTLMQVSIEEAELVRTSTGFKLVISVKSSDNYKELRDIEVYTQLAFKPRGENYYAYLPGKIEGLNEDDERIFSFDLSTNFQINSRDEIQMTEMKMFNTDERLIRTALENDFEILFATSKPPADDWEPAEVDQKLASFLAPYTIYGICNERIRLRFGYALKNLWARSRSVITSNDYLLYSENVPLLYEEDIYDLDPTTQSAVRIENGQVEYKIKHRKGDPVLDSNGEPIMKHLKGDVVLDPSGNPTFNNEYDLIRQMDILMLEGPYWFATDSITTEYKQEIMDNFINWIVDGLGDISKNLLEQTRIYFYPKSTIGQIDVMINNSVRTVINSGQRFNVRLYVSKMVYDNAELRKELTEATIRNISEELKKSTVTKSGITSRLKEAYGDDIIAFEIDGLGGGDSVETITVLNDAKRCSLRKRLVAQADGSLLIEEDVTCDFIKHDKKELG